MDRPCKRDVSICAERRRASTERRAASSDDLTRTSDKQRATVGCRTREKDLRWVSKCGLGPFAIPFVWDPYSLPIHSTAIIQYRNNTAVITVAGAPLARRGVPAASGPRRSPAVPSGRQRRRRSQRSPAVPSGRQRRERASAQRSPVVVPSGPQRSPAVPGGPQRSPACPTPPLPADPCPARCTHDAANASASSSAHGLPP